MIPNMMSFPKTWEEFEKSYGFEDREEVYTNGARLIPSFRVKQWLDHINEQPEIIRCKDCKHRELFLGRYVCQHVCFEATDEMYCSKRERREDETD